MEPHIPKWERSRALENDHRLAVDLPQSVDLRYEFIPDAAWNQARTISFSVFFLWLISTSIATCALLIKPKE